MSGSHDTSKLTVTQDLRSHMAAVSSPAVSAIAQHVCLGKFEAITDHTQVCRVKGLGGLRQLQKAQAGGPGGSQKRIGKHGTDKLMQVRN